MTLKVMLLSHGFQAEYEIGFANGLALNGVDVLLVGSDKTLAPRRQPGVRLVNLRGSQDSNRPRFAKALNLARYVAAYLTLCRAERGRLVHVNGLFSTRSVWLSLLEAWLTRLCAGPYVLTVHDVLPHDGDTPFNRWIYQRIYRAPGTLVGHTHRVATRLINEFGVAAKRIVVVEHGIDRLGAPTPALRTQFRATHGIPATAVVALFFGKIMRYKGVGILLDAMARLGENAALHLLIVGKCFDAGLQAELSAQLLAHPHRERIHWDNRFIAEEEISAVMASADFVVLPYLHIDQSGVLFMALSTGLPLVVTRVGTLADYVPQEAGEVVEPGDASTLAAAMTRLTGRLASFSSEQIRAYAQTFTWQSTLQPLLARYVADQTASQRAGE